MYDTATLKYMCGVHVHKYNLVPSLHEESDPYKSCNQHAIRLLETIIIMYTSTTNWSTVTILQQTHTSLYTSKLWLIVSVGCWLIHEDFVGNMVCHQYCSVIANLNIDCMSCSRSNGLDQCSTRTVNLHFTSIMISNKEVACSVHC